MRKKPTAVAAIIGVCLTLILTGAPIAGAVPVLPEGDESVPALSPSPGGSPPALVVQTSSTAVDWSSVALGATALAAAIAATALILTAFAGRRPTSRQTRTTC